MSKSNIKKVTELINEDPNLTVREIAKKTGLSSSGAWNILNRLNNPQLRFNSEKELESWIKENSSAVFDEDITLVDSLPLKSEDGFKYPDLIGFDSNETLVIVEVKLGEPRRDSVSQILDYASLLSEKLNSDPNWDSRLRLFIVSESISEEVNRICQFLHEIGVDIHHLSV